MKSNKSPGLDGISKEFYKMFLETHETLPIWKSCKVFWSGLIIILSAGFCNIAYTQKGALLNLDYYRPISLKNQDYEMLVFLYLQRGLNYYE